VALLKTALRPDVWPGKCQKEEDSSILGDHGRELSIVRDRRRGVSILVTLGEVKQQ